MGDSAEFEKLTEIEARLASALDRIAAGQAAIAARASAGGDATFDSGAAEAAREEAEARAGELSERVNMLEAQLAETQDALSDATADLTQAKAERDEAMAVATAPEPIDMPDVSDLEARLAEAEAARDAADATLTERDAELAARAAELEEKDAALAEAQAALIAEPEVPVDPAGSDENPDVEDMEKALAVMTRRVERARMERDEARRACDRAIDVADELREAMGVSPEERVLELRHQLRLMKTRAEDLAAQLAIVNSGADASAVEQGLVSELEALRQLRAADAAELDRIIADAEAGQAAAGGGFHA